MLSADQKGHEVWGRECVRRQGCQVLYLFSSLIEPWESFHKDLIKMPKNNKTTLFSGNFTVYCTVKHGKSYYRYFFKTNRLLTNNLLHTYQKRKQYLSVTPFRFIFFHCTFIILRLM